MNNNKPKFLFRQDGERYSLQSNGKYTMDTSQMGRKYEYELNVLKQLGFKEKEEMDFSSLASPVEV